jgi:hypothetical protein
MIPKHPVPLDYLVEAHRDLLVERATLVRQRDLIAEMKANGGDAKRAEYVLAACELSLQKFENDLRRLTRLRESGGEIMFESPRASWRPLTG